MTLGETLDQIRERHGQHADCEECRDLETIQKAYEEMIQSLKVVDFNRAAEPAPPPELHAGTYRQIPIEPTVEVEQAKGHIVGWSETPTFRLTVDDEDYDSVLPRDPEYLEDRSNSETQIS